MKQTFLIYLAILALFGSGIFLVIKHGQHLPAPGAGNTTAVTGIAPPVALDDPASAWSGMRENLQDPFSRLLLQVIVIILATRMVGALFVRCGQPAVVGEVLAGILLGPSLLGWVWPAAAGRRRRVSFFPGSRWSS